MARRRNDMDMIVGLPVEVKLDVLCSEGRFNEHGIIEDQWGMRTGVFWDDGHIQNALRSKELWSSGFCIFVPWDWMQCVAIVCPCVMLFHMLKVSGPVRIIGTSNLHIDRFKYIAAFTFIYLFGMLVPHFRTCHTSTVGHFTSTASQHLFLPDGGLTDTNGTHNSDNMSSTNSTDYRNEETCEDYTRMGMELTNWMVVFIVLSGVREKIGVSEDWWITMLKSALCLQCCLLCQFCYLPQVARHIYTSQGFVQTYVMDEEIPVILPVRSSAAQPLNTQSNVPRTREMQDAAE